MVTDVFIRRPVLATVCSILITLAGAISIPTLPIGRYPELAPPTVTVGAFYTGANAQAVESAVTTPLESVINGVEGMVYMTSASTNNGFSQITVTFEVGRDPDLAANAIHVDSARGHLLARDLDPPPVDRLEEVHAAEEGRLPRSRGADQADDLVLGERQVDTAENLELAERLVEALDAECRRGHASLPACWRRRSRATSQSVNRASGIVTATNSVAATR